MKKNIFISMFIICSIISFSTIKVAVSIIPQKTFVEAVGRDLVDVMAIIPPGYSPSNYAPTARQIIDFSTSSVYFTIGVPAETSNILPKIARNAPEVAVIRLEDFVDGQFEPRYFSEKNRDPHIWLSPKRVVVMIETISDYLCSIDEKNREYFWQNANDYINSVVELDRTLNERLSSIKNKGFFCFHPSFGYFADDYSLKMYALEENGKEATPARLMEMIELAKENGYKVIFYQAEIDSSQTEAFANEIGGKAVQLDPLASDYLGNLMSMAKVFLDVIGEENE